MGLADGPLSLIDMSAIIQRRDGLPRPVQPHHIPHPSQYPCVTQDGRRCQSQKNTTKDQADLMRMSAVGCSTINTHRGSICYNQNLFIAFSLILQPKMG